MKHVMTAIYQITKAVTQLVQALLPGGTVQNLIPVKNVPPFVATL